MTIDDPKIAAAERALHDARVALDELKIDHKLRVAERQQLLEKAGAAEAPVAEFAADFAAQRRPIVQQLHKDDSKIDELQRLEKEHESKVSDARSRAAAFREAAALLDPGIAASTKAMASAVKSVRLAEVQLTYATHLRDSAILAELLDRVEEQFPEFVKSAAAFDQAYHAAFGVAPRDLPPPHTRVARAVSVRLRHLLQPHGELMFRNWPPETASLVRELEALNLEQ